MHKRCTPQTRTGNTLPRKTTQASATPSRHGQGFSGTQGQYNDCLCTRGYSKALRSEHNGRHLSMLRTTPPALLFSASLVTPTPVSATLAPVLRNTDRTGSRAEGLLLAGNCFEKQVRNDARPI